MDIHSLLAAADLLPLKPLKKVHVLTCTHSTASRNSSPPRLDARFKEPQLRGPANNPAACQGAKQGSQRPTNAICRRGRFARTMDEREQVCARGGTYMYSSPPCTLGWQLCSYDGAPLLGCSRPQLRKESHWCRGTCKSQDLRLPKTRIGEAGWGAKIDSLWKSGASARLHGREREREVRRWMLWPAESFTSDPPTPPPPTDSTDNTA
ncbi:hypothetical protein DFP73DRAFT_236185 [Morchella snyderi]|nr:hypothetical protein DFP73DRAFT_236185 [Morchella snyderi]